MITASWCVQEESSSGPSGVTSCLIISSVSPATTSCSLAKDPPSFRHGRAVAGRTSVGLRGGWVSDALRAGGEKVQFLNCESAYCCVSMNSQTEYGYNISIAIVLGTHIAINGINIVIRSPFDWRDGRELTSLIGGHCCPWLSFCLVLDKFDSCIEISSCLFASFGKTCKYTSLSPAAAAAAAPARTVGSPNRCLSQFVSVTRAAAAGSAKSLVTVFIISCQLGL